MRVTLAIVLTCVLASQIVASPIVFRPGKEFVFHYVGQVVTGIPNSGKQAAAIKGSATVRVQIKPAGKIVVAISDVAISKAVGAVPAGAATALLPDSAVEPITAPELAAIKASVIRPFRCVYRNGMVVSVEVPADEPVWCVNLKKGILAMLQVNLHGAGQINDAHPAVAEMFMANTAKPAAGAKYFRAMEAGVAGKCEAVYAAMDAPAAIAAADASFAAAGCACTAAACRCAPAPVTAAMAGLPEMRVVKSWNFKNCALPPTVEHGILANLNLAKGINGIGKDLVIASVVADYVIAGDARNFVIKKAIQMSKFAFAPYAAEAGRMEANSIQVLVAIGAKDIAGAAILPGRDLVALPTGLKLDIPLTPMAAWPAAAAADRVAQVEALLAEACTATTPVISAAAPAVVIKAVHAIRECPAAVIQTIASKYVLTAAAAADDCAIKKRELLLDVLPAVPNAAVIPVVVDCVHAGIVSAPRAMIMINTMVLSAPPTPAAATAFLAALKEPAIANNAALRHTVMLGLGTVANKMYWAHWKMGAPKAATMPVVQQVVKELMAMCAAAATPAETIAVIKACGNAGLPELLPALAKLAADAAQPAAIRTQAIYACRRIAPFAPTKAMAILLPMFVNAAEAQDVRIAAFVAIMDMRPTAGVVHAIAHALKAEANAQVASFAYSYIATMAKATHPAFKDMAALCRHALMIVGPFFPTAFTSKAIHMDAFMQSLQMGAAIDMFIVNAPASAIPKAIVAKLNAFLLGQSINVAEVGVEAAGLQAIVHKLAGPYGLLPSILNGKKSIMDVFGPIIKPAMGSVADGVIAAMKELGIVDRPDDALAAAVYMKMFGNEMAAIGITEASVKAMVGDGNWIIAELEALLISGAEMNMLKTLALVDSAINIPTPIGAPLAIKLTAVAAVHAKGTAKVTGIASLAELTSGTVPTSPITAAVAIAPSCVIEVSCHMAFDATILRAGTAVKALVHVHMPVAAEMEVDMATWKMTAKLKLPAAAHKIAAIEVVPICYVDVVHAAPIAAVFETAVAEILDPAIIAAIPVEAPFVLPGCGVAVKIQGNLGICAPAYAPAMPLCGKQALAIMFEPAAAAAAAAIEFEVHYIGPMAAAVAPAAPAAAAAAPDRGSSWMSWLAIPTFGSADPGAAVAAVPVVAAAAAAAANFEPVTPAAAIHGAASTHAVQAVVRWHGAAVTPLAHAQVKWLYSADMMANQINCQFICLPALGVAAETKFVADIVALVPNMMAAIIPNMAPIAPAHVMCTANVAVIQAAAPIAQIAVKLAAGDMGIATDMPSLAASLLPGWAAPIPAPHAAAAAACPAAYSWTFLCDVSKMPAAMMATPTALAVAAASLLQPMLQLVAIPVAATVPAATAGHIAVVAKVIPAWQKMVVMIRGAAGAAFVMHMPIAMPMLYDVALAGALPAMPAAAPAAAAAAMPPMPAAAASIGAAYAGQCYVAANKVTTFDGVVIAIPAAAAACEAVVAKDCSAQAAFAVTATPVDASMMMKAVKVIAPGAMFEVMPHAAGAVVAVNGIRRVIPAAAPITFTAGGGTYMVVRSGDMVVIAAKFLGLTIATDCDRVIIQASAMFRGKICGLCGNFDGERAGEYAGPAMEIAASAAAFVAQYVIPSAMCQPAAIAGAAAAAPAYCAVMPAARNQMIERYYAGFKEYCFTVDAVAACPATCAPTAAVAQLAGMHCLPATKMSTVRLAQEGKLRVLHELQWKYVDAYETVEVPTACAPAA